MSPLILAVALATLVGPGAPMTTTSDDPVALTTQGDAMVVLDDHAVTERDDLRRRVAARLDRAAAEAHAALDRHLAPIETLFNRADAHVPAFVERVFGLESVLSFAADRLPFASGGRHHAYLERIVATALLDTEELEAATRRAAAGYLDALGQIEARALIDLRADLEIAPDALAITGHDPAAAEAAVVDLIDESARQARGEFRAAVGRELAVLLASEALAGATLRLVASAGLRGAATASGPASLGIALAAGLVVDQLVGRAWDCYADPRGHLTQIVRARLVDLRRVVIAGTPETPGLRGRLEAIARSRLTTLHSHILETIDATSGRERRDR